MSSTDPVLSLLLVCFNGRATAAKHRRPLVEQLIDDGAVVLDQAVLGASARRKVRVYDPRRTLAGALTPALTWGLLGLLASDGSVAGLLVWGLIGGVGGGVIAYFVEHNLSKHSLAKAGAQLPADSSALGVFLRSGDAMTMLQSTDAFGPTTASVAAIASDLSARVWVGAPNPVEHTPSTKAADPLTEGATLASLVFLRFPGRRTAHKVWAEVTGGKVDKEAAIKAELIVAVDSRSRLHVDSPSQGSRAVARSDVVTWGLFGVAFGFLAGWGAQGTFFGAVGEGVLTGLVWAVFGLAAGALYGLWAGRSDSARRLKGLNPLLPPDTSLLDAWADGVVTDEALAPWSPPGAERLVLRFTTVEHGAILET